MSLKPRSVRVRLALWYTVSLAVIIITFVIAIYLVVNASLQKQIDLQLEKDFATVSRVVTDEPAEIGELAQHGSVSLFQVLEGNEVVAETGDWSRAGLERAPLPTFATPALWSWIAPNGLPYRMKQAPAAAIGHTYLVRVAEDEQTLRQTMQSLAAILLFGIPCALLAAAFGGYFLAGRVLSPVAAMAAKAREITAERLSERLAVENPDDEFGRLAVVFNETLARLEDSFERLSRFTADASHELRTPLTAIRSVGEVGMLETTDAATCREVIGSMLEETDRLSKLVDSLLTLSRADAHSVFLHREQTDIAAFVVDVVDCLQVLAEEKEQNLDVKTERAVFAEIDRTTFRQALLNLVDNAIKYTPERGRIQVAVRFALGGEAVIEVCDNGPGIPKEHLTKVFDRFYRVDKGRSRDMGGAGLGLAITRWAVEANGGRIELESGEGKGSIFRILLSAQK